MSVAAEAFAEEQTLHNMDIRILWRRFGDFLQTLGTQPVTIPVSDIVEDMLETFELASTKASQLHTFAWAQSADLRGTLEDFIRTRECLFYTDGCLPAVDATFGLPSRQSEDELTVEIRYAWNPPMVNFKTFQNVFDENRSFHLEPRMSQPCHDLETTYSVDQSVPIMNWNASERCFEGYCPPLLASRMGAERLECFSMPLNMSAQVTTDFPGGMSFERTIRLEIPITIRRRPDACSSDEQLKKSPAVRGSAASVTIPSTDTTPQSAEACCPGNDVEIGSLWTSYKEISALMDRKARAASGKPSSPLRLNPLSLAHLWEVTAPTPSSREVQCWSVGVGQRSSPVQPKTPSRSPPRGSVVTDDRDDSSGAGQTTTPAKTPRRVAEGRVEKSVNKHKSMSLSKHLLKVVDYSPYEASTIADRTNESNPGPSRMSSSSASPKSRADSPVASLHPKASNNFVLSVKQLRYLHAKTARAYAKKMHASGGSTPGRPEECRDASPDQLKEWRKAPERLNEAEKDDLQSAIQAAHRKDLEEMEKNQEEAEESMLVEGDEDSMSLECDF